VEAVKTTLKNQPFVIYLVGNVTFWLGFNIITLCIPLYVTILMGGTEGDTVIFLGIVMGVALLSFMPINILAKKYGLKMIMMTSLAGFMVILPFAFFMGKPVSFLSPLAFAYILMALSGIPVAAIFMVPDAIVAEVSDLEENLSGQHREAMYYGTQNFILKLAMGFSTLVTGFLLQWFGSTPDQPLGVQLTGPVAALFLLIGVIVFSRYPQKEITARQVEKALRL
jgi:glycoside/pentoside/hexuronide:cation symporter, GPH family